MTTNSYDLLHQGLKRFIYKKGWGSLRDIQLKAIKPILAKKSDVIIAASTASGKTEGLLFTLNYCYNTEQKSRC